MPLYILIPVIGSMYGGIAYAIAVALFATKNTASDEWSLPLRKALALWVGVCSLFVPALWDPLRCPGTCHEEALVLFAFAATFVGGVLLCTVIVPAVIRYQTLRNVGMYGKCPSCGQRVRLDNPRGICLKHTDLFGHPCRGYRQPPKEAILEKESPL